MVRYYGMRGGRAYALPYSSPGLNVLPRHVEGQPHLASYLTNTVAVSIHRPAHVLDREGRLGNGQWRGQSDHRLDNDRGDGFGEDDARGGTEQRTDESADHVRGTGRE